MVVLYFWNKQTIY